MLSFPLYVLIFFLFKYLFKDSGFVLFHFNCDIKKYTGKTGKYVMYTTHEGLHISLSG